MLRNFIESLFSKGFTSISNFLTVILTAQFLGAEGRGELTLIILSVSIVGLVQNIAGGAAISYYAGKMANSSIILISSSWLLISVFVVSFLLNYFSLSPKAWLFFVVIISFLLGGISNAQSFLLGLEKIRLMNLLEILKSLLLIGFIAIHFFVVEEISLLAVLHSYVAAYGLCLLVSIFLLFKHLNLDKMRGSWQHVRQIFQTGFELQVNNILQLVNYRFTFFIIEKYWGLSTLGIVSVSVSLGETVWIICKSAATVLYSRLLNETDQLRQIELTVVFTKLSYLLTAVATFVIIFIPSSWYQFLFGKEFGEINQILLVYGPSILFLAFFTMLNHYFTAQNKNRINILATFIGNTVVVLLGFMLIPIYGMVASGMVISIAYLIMLVVLLVVFCKHTNTKWTIFFIQFRSVFQIQKNAV